MAEHQVERRANNRELHDKIDALINLMTMHVHSQETSIAELKQIVDDYFDKLDAPTHNKHHDFVAGEMKTDEKNSVFWEKVREGVVGKLIVFLLGAIMSYLGAVLWFDLKDKINKDEKPAVQQQQQYQLVPPVPPQLQQHVMPQRPTGKEQNVSNTP